MINDKGIIINKYGAVDVKIISDLMDEIVALKKRCYAVEYVLGTDLSMFDGMARRFLHDDKMKHNIICRVEGIREDIKKIVELTKCNDYEFVTEIKLIKKERIK